MKMGDNEKEKKRKELQTLKRYQGGGGKQGEWSVQQAFSIHSDYPMLIRHVWKSGPRDRCKVKAPFPPPSTPTVVLPWRVFFFLFCMLLAVYVQYLHGYMAGDGGAEKK